MLSCPPPKNGRRYFPVVGDGRCLEYLDRSFDLAFANSVIEHVGGPSDADALASEMQRVGKAFYCQTPSKWFPVEPHVGTLFLHWVPGLLNIMPSPLLHIVGINPQAGPQTGTVGS